MKDYKIKEYKVLLIMRIDAETSEQAHNYVKDWCTKLGESKDNVPKGFNGFVDLTDVIN